MLDTFNGARKATNNLSYIVHTSLPNGFFEFFESQKIEKLFCHLFGMPDETNINETRNRKFCMENTPEPY